MLGGGGCAPRPQSRGPTDPSRRNADPTALGGHSAFGHPPQFVSLSLWIAPQAQSAWAPSNPTEFPLKSSPQTRPGQPERVPVSMRGALTVKWINGRNGEFAVGELNTPIGEFKVKDSLLDQFEEGTYAGIFWISQIFSKSYEYRGRITIETRAVLADLQIDDESKHAAEHEPTELDPIDEPPPAPVPVPVPPPRPRIVVPPRRPASTGGAERNRQASPRGVEPQDLELFGDEIAEQVRLQAPVKLDTTIDRARLRAQRKRLDQLGYAFNSRSQTFSHGGDTTA